MLWFIFLFFNSVSGQSPILVDRTNCTACSPYYCTNETCQFGSVTPHPSCDCCYQCRRGLRKICGSLLGVTEICAEGLICDGGTFRSSICVIPVDETIDASNCSACTEYYSCTNKTCELGSMPHPYCDCCTVCLKVEGDICDVHPYLPDKCAEGLICSGGLLSPSCINASISANTCPHCSPHDCPKRPCLYDTIPNPRCECCPVCLKGPGESCGGATLLPNVCAESLTCVVGNFFSSKSKGICSEDGSPVRPPFFPLGGPFPFHGNPRGRKGSNRNRKRGRNGRHG